MKRSDCMIGSKRGFKVKDPGVSQVWTMSKDTEALCVNLAGKLAPYQARPDTGRGAGREERSRERLGTSCLESAQLHLQMERVEQPAGKGWGRGEPGKLGRLTQAHKLG